ncbi:SsgA family sporulation/cell division regulator [Streptomyces kanasensis]|uniref:SsgA family sporulation/cell division regulator n=1 Tax=Streptomyces kanasensis TaxID=936756 RepID=UPI0036F7616B
MDSRTGHGSGAAPPARDVPVTGAPARDGSPRDGSVPDGDGPVRRGGGAGPYGAAPARVEARARGMVVTDGPLSRPVPVALRYEPGAEPPSVRFVLPAGSWTFPRTVLERGLRFPAHGDEVDVWPCGRVQTVVEFHSPEGTSVVQFDSSALRSFLRRTYAATTPVTR